MIRRVAATLLIEAALGATVPSIASARPFARIAGPFGRGTAQVWVLRPPGPVRDVVVFGHGWKTAPPSASYPWVGQFLPWLDHLVAAGSAIVFPRYQLGGVDPQNADRVRAFEQGIRTGYLRLGRPRVPFVLAGYSFGASLAFYYSADAARLGLPVPRAVDAIFPAGMVPGAPLGGLDPSVHVLIQVGDQDTEAGAGGANAFWAWLDRHPKERKKYELVRSTPSFSATHAAPKETSVAARRAFWAPLDRMIALSRS